MFSLRGFYDPYILYGTIYRKVIHECINTRTHTNREIYVVKALRMKTNMNSTHKKESQLEQHNGS